MILGREKSRVTDIKVESLEKIVNIKGKQLKIILNNVMSGEVNGNREILDEPLIENLVEQITRVITCNYSQYVKIPDVITIGKQEDILVNHALNNEDSDSSAKMIESYEPRYSLEQIALNESVRDEIFTAISAVTHREKMISEWGMEDCFAGNRAIILNFYGKPGTGKSMTAEAIAKALNKKVYQVNYSELESKYVGETPKNIRRAFECATRDNAILVFDEADSFLGKRLTSVTQSADYGVNITRSVLLMELEKFSGVVVFTTNLIKNYDEAFKRRILLSIYFDMPDETARKQIWSLHLNEKMPLAENVNEEILAERFTAISGADIKDMIFYAALHTLQNGKRAIDIDTFSHAYSVIRDRYLDKSAQSSVEIISDDIISEEQYMGEISCGGQS